MSVGTRSARIMPVRKKPLLDGEGRKVVHGSKQHKLAVLDRRRQVSELYLQGWPQDEIAEKFGVSPTAISLDLKGIRERWQAQVMMNFEERKMQELAKIDQLELWATEAWKRSCEDAVVSTRKTEKAMQVVPKNKDGANKRRTGKGMVGEPVPEMKMVPVRRYVEEQRRGQAGNPAFLDKVTWCIETRLALFGVIEQKMNQVNVMSINWDGLASKPRTTRDDVEEKLLLLEQKAATVEEAEVVNTDRGERNGKH